MCTQCKTEVKLSRAHEDQVEGQERRVEVWRK